MNLDEVVRVHILMSLAGPRAAIEVTTQRNLTYRHTSHAIYRYRHINVRE